MARRCGMVEVSAAVMRQLEEAQARLAATAVTAGPPILTAPTEARVPEAPVGGAGSGTAQHVIVDHYFTAGVQRIWAFASGEWRYRDVTHVEEEGIAQVAFAATRVDTAWDSSNVVSVLRCWKTF
jgi:hypothetical protein